MNRTVTAWIPAIACAIVIFFLSAMQHPPELGPVFPLKDKFEHFTVYMLLGALIYRALRRGHGARLVTAAALAIVLTSAYGASDEFHQRLVPHRTCDVWDWTADSLAGVVAASLYFAYESRRSQKTNR